MNKLLKLKPVSIDFNRCFVQQLHNKNDGFVLGCGSNVVDQIHKVQAVPDVGTKGFFLSPTKTLEKSIVGGVTLNHLAWASLFGVPTGLMALQGNDNAGRLIRKELKNLKISDEFVVVKDEYTSSESYVFLQPDGERSIIMAPGATSLINGDAVKKNFGQAINTRASMLTTEISQVPLKGVLELLMQAKKSNILSIVDLDVSPSVAFDEAKLGTMDELNKVLCNASIIKPTLHAAEEFLAINRPDLKDNLKPDDVVKYLIELTNAEMVAITNGSKNAILGTKDHLVSVPVRPLKKLVDATGAGDAFLGGLIAGIHFNGFPLFEEELWKLGELSNKTGACNCMVLGALPNLESKHQLRSEIEYFQAMTNTYTSISPPSSSDTQPSLFLESIQSDLNSIKELQQVLNLKSVDEFVNQIDSCGGNVFVSGIGKSGVVGTRFAASLSSIGVPSQFVHATEWAHGDLGKVSDNDIAILISHSGNTDEVTRAMQLLKKKNIKILALIGSEDSILGRECNHSICYNVQNLTEPLGGIPTSSIILQDTLINGIMCELIDRRKLTRSDFVKNHPGGSLGVKFTK
eukprot:TCONS_00050905-protein